MFIHSLSPIKNTKKKRVPYFDCLVQTSDRNKVRAVCYDPKQRKNLIQPYQQKSPVKITAAKPLADTSFSTIDEEFKITKKSKIVPLSTELAYNPEISSPSVTVSEALLTDEYNLVDVTAKVISKNHQSQLIIKDERQLRKNNCIIGDKTDSMKLVLWEDSINAVEYGKTYTFRGVKVRIFDDTKLLNTNPSTVIDPSAEEIQDINLTSEEIHEIIVERHCIGVITKKQKLVLSAMAHSIV